MMPILIPARAAATIIAAALLATACGGSPSSVSSGSAASPSQVASPASPSGVAYSACVRSHGVPDYPDPDRNGHLPKTDAQHLGVSDSQFQAAEQACRNLLPAAGSTQQQAQQCFEAGNCPPALVQQILAVERRFSQCMRSHGVPRWPDPSIDSEGRPVFAISVSRDGFDPHSQFLSQQDECGRLTGSPEPRAISP